MPKATAPAAATGLPEIDADEFQSLAAAFHAADADTQREAIELLQAQGERCKLRPGSSTASLRGPETLRQIDHVSFTKDFVEAALMAANSLSEPREMNALATLCGHIIERLEALVVMLGQDDREVQS